MHKNVAKVSLKLYILTKIGENILLIFHTSVFSYYVWVSIHIDQPPNHSPWLLNSCRKITFCPS